VVEAVEGLAEQYVHLYLALPASGAARERVSGTRDAPIPLSAAVEALMRDVVALVTTWAEPTAEAAGVTGAASPRRLGPDVQFRRTWVTVVTVELDPSGRPVRDPTTGEVFAVARTERGPTVDVLTRRDDTTGVALTGACRTLAAHVDTLLALPPTWVHEWDDQAGPDGSWQPAERSGIDAGLAMLSLRGRIRATLGETRGRDYLAGVACPECGRKLLYRDHGSDTRYCDGCGEEWTKDMLDRWVAMLANDARMRGAAG